MEGNTSFVPVVPPSDPDLTIYEDVDQILLSQGSSMPSTQQKAPPTILKATLNNPVSENPEVENENDQEPEPFKVLDPEDVSRTFTELQDTSGGPNCSAITGSQVKRDSFFLFWRLVFCSWHSIIHETQINNFHVVKGFLAAFCMTKVRVNNFWQDDTAPNPEVADNVEKAGKQLSSTPGNTKKLKRAKTLNPEDVAILKSRRVDREASESIKNAADKIMEAAMLIINCMNELKPELRALSNRNYREIQMSTNAVKQLVS